VSQDDGSQQIISAALLLQSSLVPPDDIELPVAELKPGVFSKLIYNLHMAKRRGFRLEVIATINVRKTARDSALLQK